MNAQVSQLQQRVAQLCSRCSALSSAQSQLMAPAPTPKPPASPSQKFIVAVKSEKDWQEQVMQAPGTQLCVCDIYSKWCGPCVALDKRILNLSSDFAEYDIKWIQVCADEVTKFQDMGVGSKPLIILYKMGLECGKMDKGADGNVLQRLVDANKGDKQA